MLFKSPLVRSCDLDLNHPGNYQPSTCPPPTADEHLKGSGLRDNQKKAILLIFVHTASSLHSLCKYLKTRYDICSSLHTAEAGFHVRQVFQNVATVLWRRRRLKAERLRGKERVLSVCTHYTRFYVVKSEQSAKRERLCVCACSSRKYQVSTSFK